MSNEELRVIPSKNYIIFAGVILLTLLLIYYFYMWVDAYNETKLNRPILDKYMELINYNELNNYLVENPNTIIYVSVLENEEIREFEKKVKGLYRKHLVGRDILYLNITEDIKKKDIKTEMQNEFNVNSLDKNVPLVIVYESEGIKDIYNIKDDNYNIDNFKLFIDNISFSNEADVDG